MRHPPPRTYFNSSWNLFLFFSTINLGDRARWEKFNRFLWQNEQLRSSHVWLQWWYYAGPLGLLWWRKEGMCCKSIWKNRGLCTFVNPVFSKYNVHGHLGWKDGLTNVWYRTNRVELIFPGSLKSHHSILQSNNMLLLGQVTNESSGIKVTACY